MADAPNSKIMIGHKLRKLRAELGLNQADMASELGISASYLNLLENNARPVTVPLLFRLGQAYDVDLREMAEDDGARLAARLTEIFADPALQATRLSRRDIQALASQNPVAAQAIIQLFDQFDNQRSASRSDTHAETIQTRPAPVEAVRQFFEDQNNHFPALEQAAADTRKTAQLPVTGPVVSALAQTLADRAGLTVRIMPADVMGPVLRQHDLHRGRLLLNELLSQAQLTFQIALQLGLSLYRDQMDRLLTEGGLNDSEARQLGLLALAGYFAGALMMPYEIFYESARQTRHDLDLLSRRFGASFEQICHRLTTLARPGMRGVPFFFLRVDEAGNITKRLSGGGIELARHGGACGRWLPHQIFRTPGQTLAQLAELEDGFRLITLARTVSPARTGPVHIPAPVHAVALGCEMKYAAEIVHADSLALHKQAPIVPIGMSCRFCERNACQHRGSPPIGRPVQFDSSRRQSGLFDFQS